MAWIEGCREFVERNFSPLFADENDGLEVRYTWFFATDWKSVLPGFLH